MIELRHLRLVKAIVEAGSITRAIDTLNLSQSALSYQLKEAEYQLGTNIFLRINKKLVLTQAGEKFLELANEVIEKVGNTELQIKQMLGGEVGEIRLSTECYTSYYWLPSLMHKFHGIYPNVELNIVMEATHNPLQKLLSGSLDVAITSDPLEDEHIQYTFLFEDEMVAVVSDSHEWANKKFILAEDFLHQNLIIHSLPMETVTIHQFFLKPSKISPKKVTVLPLTEASIEMVKANMGVMVMARWALKPYLQNSNLRTIKIGNNGLKRKNYLATLHQPHRSAYFNHFIEFLQQEIHLD